MATRPRDCELLVALPLSRDEFASALEDPSRSDFAAVLARQHRFVREHSIWADVYQPEAEYLGEIATFAARRGLAVRTRATREDFARAFIDHQVVILVAHWRGAQLQPTDVRAPRQLMAALATQGVGSRGNAAVRSEVKALAAVERTDDSLAVELARILNAHVIRWIDGSSNDDERVQVARLLEAFEARETLDRTFAEHIRAGNRIEFYDGLRSVSDTCAAIPPDYRGVIDFTVCSSACIGAALRAARHCRVIVSQAPTRLRLRMAILREIITLIDEGDVDYVDAVLRMRIGLLHTTARRSR